MATDDFRGIIAALLTPFDEAGQVRHAAIKPLVSRLIDEGIAGLFVCGTTGLWWLLSTEERMDIADSALKAVEGRIKVMIHVGAHRTEDSIRLAQHAEQIGADAISALPPTGIPYPPEAVWQHFKDIGASCALPLYLYHLPQVHGDLITMDRFIEALDSIPTLAGVKFSSYQIDHLIELKIKSAGRLNILSGCTEQLLSTLVCGAQGSVCSWYNLLPRLACKISACVADSDLAQARELQHTLIKLIVDIRSKGHHLLCRLVSECGVDVGVPRKPLPRMSDEEYKRLLPDIKQSGLFDWSI